MRFEELIAFERKDAAEKNTIQNILDLLEDYGEIPETLKEKLEQSNSESLRKYHKLAAKANSIEAFIEMIK